MRINVIMPSFLGDYPNAASNRVEKFKRAVESFFQQQHSDKKLFIMSDNCRITRDAIRVIKHKWRIERIEDSRNEHFYYSLITEKQPMFSGFVRNKPIYLSKIDDDPNSVICYLDTDDVLLPHHLSFIANCFADPKIDWIYADDLVATDTSVNYRVRSNEMKFGRIGTSAIAHRTSCDVKWQDGYGHDWKFIEDLFAKYPNFKHAGQNGYVVCHIPGQIDF